MPKSADSVVSTVGLWQSAQTVLADLLDSDPEQRSLELERRCQGRPELRAYLEMLLAKSEQDNDWIEEAANAARDERLLKEGMVLAGRFEVVRHLGTGGMSEVYEVVDVYSSEHQALKVLRPELCDNETTIQRIKHEIRIARQVSHPNVCRIHEVHRDEDPGRFPRVLHFFTMELLKGITLGEHLKQTGPLSAKDALSLLEPIAAGLSEAHNAGVIHRDLKPSNIMIVRGAGNRTRVIIADFGMAMPGTADLPRMLPQGHLIGGTPRYMAPEQFVTDDATPATDMFALGVIIYEMLTGCTPFKASQLTRLLESATQPDRTLHPAPDSRIPQRWSGAIVRCLDPSPANRFASVAELMNALRGDARRLARRAILGLGATAAVAGAVSWKMPGAADGLGTANAEARAAYLRASLQGKRLTTEELFKSVRNFEEAVRLDPKFAEAYAGLAECYARLQDYGGMGFREAAAKAQASAREAIRLKPNLAEAHAALGVSLSLDVDRWRTCEASFLRALELRETYASAHHWYGVHLARTGRTNDAVRKLREAQRHEPASLPIVNALGWMLYFDKQYEAAAAQALGTIDLDPNYFYSHLLLARSYSELRRYAEAMEMCNLAAQLSQRGALGRVQALPAVIASASACILATSGDTQQARSLLQQLSRRRSAEYIPAHYIATIQCLLGDLEDAMQTMEAAYAQRDPGVLYARIYPQFRGLQGHPRYPKLLAGIGFPDLDVRAETATG